MVDLMNVLWFKQGEVWVRHNTDTSKFAMSKDLKSLYKIGIYGKVE
jgi:hypothetical protein